MKTYRWLYILAVFIGPYMTVSAVWTIADIFNACMAIPNMIALIVLSGVVVKETKDYFKRLDEAAATRTTLRRATPPTIGKPKRQRRRTRP